MILAQCVEGILKPHCLYNDEEDNGTQQHMATLT